MEVLPAVVAAAVWTVAQEAASVEELRVAAGMGAVTAAWEMAGAAMVVAGAREVEALAVATLDMVGATVGADGVEQAALAVGGAVGEVLQEEAEVAAVAEKAGVVEGLTVVASVAAAVEASEEEAAAVAALARTLSGPMRQILCQESCQAWQASAKESAWR